MDMKDISNCKMGSNVSQSQPVIISIEGNVGSGKSSAISFFEQYLKDKKITNIIVCQEPVQEWMSVMDEHGTSILSNLYKDPKRFAFRFQIMAFITRLSILRNALKKPNVSVILTERCILTDANVFAKMLYDDGKIELDEYTIYTKWFDEYSKDVMPSGIIYYKADPEVCMARVLSRNRSGEDTINLPYLEKCGKYTDEWIDECIPVIPTLVLNANIDKAVRNHNDEIHAFITKLVTDIKMGVKSRGSSGIRNNRPIIGIGYLTYMSNV
jgi:deoxynucleoside kinase